MGIRRVLLLSAALPALAAIALALALGGGGGAPALAQQAGGRTYESKAFTHRVHLNKATQEECVLCHAAEVPAKPAGERSLASFTRCDRCHAAEKSIQVVQKPVAAKARWPRFYHDRHASVRCDACHQYDRGKDTFSAPKDMTLCATCHGAHDTKKAFYAGDPKAAQACDACHMQPKIALLRPEQRGAFSHRLHLPLERPATKADCLRCHAGADGSKDLRDGKLAGASEAACRACHIPAAPAAAGKPGDAPAKLTVRKETVERFFTEFPHAAHVKTLDCAACHALGKDDRYAFAEGREKLPSYAGCVGCHEHQGWAVTDHGKPIQCGRCHEQGTSAIRTALFEKKGLGAITFGGVEHPFLGARDMTEECARCHYRSREAVPSGIEGKPFSHAAHRTERCESCHEGLARSGSPADSGAVDLGKACAGCHKGEAPRFAGTPARTVSSPPFSHDRHLAAAGRRPALEKGCLACHDLDLAKDAVRTPPEVASCKRCHDHKAHADVTGQDLDRCIKCHTGDSLHRDLEKTTIERLHVETAANPHQMHDMASGECRRCHAGAPVAVERMGTGVVKHRNDPHVGLALDSCGKCHLIPKGF